MQPRFDNLGIPKVKACRGVPVRPGVHRYYYTKHIGKRSNFFLAMVTYSCVYEVTGEGRNDRGCYIDYIVY